MPEPLTGAAPMRCLKLATALVLTAACADPAPPAPPRDAAAQRAHDSMIGASALPGAGGVRGALRATDSADARRVREDSISGTP